MVYLNARGVDWKIMQIENGAINIGKRALGYISKAGVDVTLPRTEALNINNNAVSDLRSLGFKT